VLGNLARLELIEGRRGDTLLHQESSSEQHYEANDSCCGEARSYLHGFLSDCYNLE
jgi:hypothetical protein